MIHEGRPLGPPRYKLPGRRIGETKARYLTRMTEEGLCPECGGKHEAFHCARVRRRARRHPCERQPENGPYRGRGSVLTVPPGLEGWALREFRRSMQRGAR